MDPQLSKMIAMDLMKILAKYEDHISAEEWYSHLISLFRVSFKLQVLESDLDTDTARKVLMTIVANMVRELMDVASRKDELSKDQFQPDSLDADACKDDLDIVVKNILGHKIGPDDLDRNA